MSAELLPLLQTILARLDSIESKIGGSEVEKKIDGVPELPRSIKAFDSYSTSNLDPFVAACTKLGGDAQVLGSNVKEAWGELRKFLLLATACKEPAPAAVQGLLGGMSAQLKLIKEMSKNRNEWERHTKTCDEGIACLSWVVIKPAPRDFIESFVGGSDYHANKIRVEFRKINPDQVAFCDTFKSLLLELMAYVKEFHTTGVAWNAKGIDVSEYDANAVVAAPSAAKVAAPAAAKAAPAAAAVANAPKVNLFSALNKGGDITSGLKTVTKDMQTWRTEYKGDATAVATKAPVAPRAVEQVKGTPKLEYSDAGRKWSVEYQSAASGTAYVAIKDKSETVYIFGCIGATIDVTGKCKSIILDSCKKTKVYFDSAMASCEVVNCQRIDLFVRDKVHAVAIDKTDGIVVHLPASSLDTEVVASKSSEMNISFPDSNGDIIERPIPEQYVHRIKGHSITADVSDLYGH